MPTYPRPPIDPEAEASLTALAEPIPAVPPGSVPALRQAALPVVSDETLLAAGLTRRDVAVTVEHAAELGIDPGGLIGAGAGAGAGGGLAAGTTILARDREGPALVGQFLHPSDARRPGPHRLQHPVRGRRHLGGGRATARDGTRCWATGAEPTRCRSTQRPPSWHAGVQAELHVWPGGHHGFDMRAPDSGIARAAIAGRNGWVARTLDTRSPGMSGRQVRAVASAGRD